MPAKSSTATQERRFVLPTRRDSELRARVVKHNAAVTPDRRVTATQALAVYRRGAHEFSHLPLTASGFTHHDWAMRRVDAFLHLVRRGRPTNPLYTADNDLLPASHPRVERKTATITASAVARDELTVTLVGDDDYTSSESAILSLSEYSGMGYDAIPAIRAVWLRAVNDGDDPFIRAKDLAIQLYASNDADLLPLKKKKMGHA